MSAEDGKSLSERVEVPGISKEAAKKIALLEQEFINAEVEQRMYTLQLKKPMLCIEGYRSLT